MAAVEPGDPTMLSGENALDHGPFSEAGEGSGSTAGLLVGVLVHARSGPGRIASVATAAARATGAIVLTGAQTLDIDPYIGSVVRDRPLLAIDRVRYLGEPVAAVVAATEAEARAAAALVTVDVAPLSPAITGAAPGELPLVHLTDLLRPGPLADRVPLTRANGNVVAAVAHIPERQRSQDCLRGTFSIDLPGPLASERLESLADTRGGALMLRSASGDRDRVRRELPELFDPACGGLRIEPGASKSPLAPGVDGIAALLARRARGAVRLVADTSDFGWSGPRAEVTIDDTGAALTIDAGASAGELPLWIDELAVALLERAVAAEVTVKIVYSEKPPIAATLDDWRAALKSL